jgi:hypothetical protein
MTSGMLPSLRWLCVEKRTFRHAVNSVRRQLHVLERVVEGPKHETSGNPAGSSLTKMCDALFIEGRVGRERMDGELNFAAGINTSRLHDHCLLVQFQALIQDLLGVIGGSDPRV